MKRTLIACALGSLLLGGPAAAVPGVDEPSTVHVNAVRNPELRKYKAILAGLEAFEKHHALAPRVPELRFRLQLAAPSPSTALNLTVFNPPAGAGALGRHVATSGPYSDAIAGVVIETLSLQPGRYLVVPSTYKAGVQAAFRLVMYSSASGVQIVPIKLKKA